MKHLSHEPTGSTLEGVQLLETNAITQNTIQVRQGRRNPPLGADSIGCRPYGVTVAQYEHSRHHNHEM